MSRWGPRRFGGASVTGGGGGATTYLGLTDTPGSYTTPGASVVVNPGGTGLIEGPIPVSTWLGLTDTPGSFSALQLVRANAAGTALEFVPPAPPSAVGPLDVTDRTNRSGSPMAVGTIVAPHASTNKSLVDADPATDVQASRPVGVVVEPGGIADLATGAIRTISGLDVPVLLVAALTIGAGVGELHTGQEVVISNTAGSGTLPGSAVAEPLAAGTVKQRVGLVVDLLTYDGGGDLLVLIQIDFGQRRVN
jgi:hypothetical protein